MEAHPTDSSADDHRRRELDFMRELEEQSGGARPEADESAVAAAGGDVVEPSPPADEPRA
jgi:hypothetical protein